MNGLGGNTLNPALAGRKDVFKSEKEFKLEHKEIVFTFRYWP